jgi:hypothetical protein
MTDRMLARKLRRMAYIKTRQGKMSERDRDLIFKGSRDAATIKLWRAKLETPAYGAPWVGVDASEGIDWPSIWEWLRNNWPTILKILLTLILLGDKTDEDTSSTDTLHP